MEFKAKFKGEGFLAGWFKRPPYTRTIANNIRPSIRVAYCLVIVSLSSFFPPSFCSQELVEQVMILRAAVAQLGGQPQSIQTGTLSNLLGQYAAILAAQGSLTSSINYLLDPTEVL